MRQGSDLKLLKGLAGLLLRTHFQDWSISPAIITSHLEDHCQPSHTNPAAHMIYGIKNLKAALPGSFDTINCMPSEVNFTVDPNTALVQPSVRRVAIQIWEEIEAQLQKWCPWESPILVYSHCLDIIPYLPKGGSIAIHICVELKDLKSQH